MDCEIAVKPGKLGKRQNHCDVARRAGTGEVSDSTHVIGAPPSIGVFLQHVFLKGTKNIYSQTRGGRELS